MTAAMRARFSPPMGMAVLPNAEEYVSVSRITSPTSSWLVTRWTPSAGTWSTGCCARIAA